MAGGRSIGFQVKSTMRSWAPAQDYLVTEVVEHLDSQYRCLISHKSTDTFDDTKFQSLKSAATVDTFQPYSYYPEKSLVLYEEVLYRVIVAHTSTDVWDPTKFELVKGGAAEDPSVSDWAPNTPYSVGRLVIFQSTLYRCIEAHTSATYFDVSKFQATSQPPPILAPRFLQPLEESVHGYQVSILMGNYYHDYGVEQGKAIYEIADNLEFIPKIATHTKTFDFATHIFSSLPYGATLFLRTRYGDIMEGLSPWAYCIFHTPEVSVKPFEISYPPQVSYGSSVSVSVSGFESWEPTETFVKAILRIYSDATLSTLVHSTDVYSDTLIPVPSTYIAFLNTQYFKITLVGSISEFSVTGSFITFQSVETPTLTVPLTCRRGALLSASTSPFSSLTPSETHVSTYYTYGVLPSVSDPVLANGLESFSIQTTPWVTGSIYTFKVQHVGSFLPSAFSDPQTVEILTSVHTPTVSCAFPTYLLGEIITFTTSAFVTSDVLETHEGTLWEFYQGATLLLSDISDTKLTSYTFNSALYPPGEVVCYATFIGSEDVSESASTSTTTTEPAPWVFGYGTSAVEGMVASVWDIPGNQILTSVNATRHQFMWINAETGGIIRVRRTNDMYPPQVICNPLYLATVASNIVTVSRRNTSSSYVYIFSSTGNRASAGRYTPPSGNLQFTAVSEVSSGLMVGGRTSDTNWRGILSLLSASTLNVTGSRYISYGAIDTHVVEVQGADTLFYALLQVGSDAIVLKCNQDFTEVWSRKIHGTVGHTLRLVDLDIVVGGYLSSTGAGVLVTLDSSGNSTGVCFTDFKVYGVSKSLISGALWLCGGINGQGGVAHYLGNSPVELFTLGGASIDFFKDVHLKYHTPVAVGQTQAVTTFDPTNPDIVILRNPKVCSAFGKETIFVATTAGPTVSSVTASISSLTITRSNYTTNPTSMTYNSQAL